jgi:cyclophilin family peptidyl-prolyl cis-trans isomerase
VGFLVQRLLRTGKYIPTSVWRQAKQPALRAQLLRGLRGHKASVEVLGWLMGWLPKSPEELRKSPRELRLAVPTALGVFSDKAALAQLLPWWKVLLGDPELHVVFATLEVLAGWHDVPRGTGLGKLVKGLAKSGKKTATALVAPLEAVRLRALAGLDPSDFKTQVPAWAAADAWEIRAALARVLFSKEASSQQNRVERRLWDDPDRRVRLVALEAIAKRPGEAVLHMLKERLGTQEPPLVAEAARALVQRAGEEVPEDLPGKIFAAVRRLPVMHHEERSTLVGLLVRCQAGELLERLKRDPDVLIREAVHLSLGLPRPPRSARKLPGREFYVKNLIRYPAHSRVRVVTTRGEFEILLDVARTPLNCWNFLALVTTGFYHGLSFHRVVPGFVAQGGDPRRDGFGGPGYMVRCERTMTPYRRGTVGMALAGKDTGGSQFFITYGDAPRLEGGYTVLGEVVRGMTVVESLLPGDGILKAELVRGP